jgi:hypothetical protein
VGFELCVRAHSAGPILGKPRGSGRSDAARRDTRSYDVTNPEIPERTRGGLAGKLAGRVKEAAASVIGHEDLAREGRLQQAQVEAEADAAVADERARQAEAQAELEAERTEHEIERERLENEIAAREREEQIERDRREAQIAARADAQRDKAAVERQEQLHERGADIAERAAQAERVAAAQETTRLEQEARAAQAAADAIDPEER